MTLTACTALAAGMVLAGAAAASASPARVTSLPSDPVVSSTFPLTPTGGSAYQEAYNPTTGLLYVANITFNSTANTVDTAINVIYTESATQASTGGLYPDATTNEVVDTILFGPDENGGAYPSAPFGLTINPKSNQLLGTSDLDGTAYLINVDPGAGASYDTVQASFPFGSDTSGAGDRSATVDEAHNLWFVGNPGAATVTEIDGTSGQIVQTFDTGTGGKGLTTDAVYDPQTNLVYAENAGVSPNGTVSVIDPTSGSVLTQITVGPTPVYAAYDSATQRLFVTNENYGETSGTVSVIDTNPDSPTYNTVLTTTAVDAAPIGAAVDESDGLVWITNFGGNSVSVLDDQTGALLSTVPVGNEPDQPVLDPVTHRVYVDNLLDDTVSVIDPPASLAPTSGSESISATVPPQGAGSFSWTINGTDHAVTLSDATNKGSYLESTGGLVPVTVTDTRVGGPTWSVSGQVSDFTGGLSGKDLGWTPTVTTPGGGATAGDPVASGFDSGNGLADPATLASAAAGHDTGSATVGADLDLKVPAATAPGTYTATLTLTALS